MYYALQYNNSIKKTLFLNVILSRAKTLHTRQWNMRSSAIHYNIGNYANALLYFIIHGNGVSTCNPFSRFYLLFWLLYHTHTHTRVHNLGGNKLVEYSFLRWDMRWLRGKGKLYYDTRDDLQFPGTKSRCGVGGVENRINFFF